MGRTLFYKLHRNPAIKVTDQDWERIDKLTTCFRTKFRWSCETVGFYTLDFHPRWRESFPDSRLPSDQKSWEFATGDIGRSMSGYGGEYWGMISETEARLRSKQAFNKIRELLKHINL